MDFLEQAVWEMSLLEEISETPGLLFNLICVLLSIVRIIMAFIDKRKHR